MDTIIAVHTFLVVGGSASSKIEADDATRSNRLSIVIVETKRANAVFKFMVEGGTVEENE